MPIDFNQMNQGQFYTRPQLAKMWGFKGFEALSRGIVTPARSPYIILFITKEKQTFQTQYQDAFVDGILEIEGETNHSADQRIIQADVKNEEVHLFFRKRHHLPFTYEGKIYLADYRLHGDKPSRFRFAVDKVTALAAEAIRTEEETYGTIPGSSFIPDKEGRKRLVKHIAYERSRKNRAKAIEIHGTSCKACGFNFNRVYGDDFARDYIQIHHVKSITEQEGIPVNPKTDLIPLCSNCHSMIHRKRNELISLEELTKRITKISGR